MIGLFGYSGQFGPNKMIMCCRFLTMLLVPALLLTQWVNGSRCMGGCEAAARDSRPHVHFSTALTENTSSKKCSCQRQHKTQPTSSDLYSHEYVTSLCDAVEQPGRPASDDNILFLSFEAFLGLPAGASGVADTVSDVGLQEACYYALPSCLNFMSFNSFLRFAVTPPPNVSCPLYVRVCSFLI